VWGERESRQEVRYCVFVALDVVALYTNGEWTIGEKGL
jgi:hypothetical protein